jgi:hypothetical protein
MHWLQAGATGSDASISGSLTRSAGLSSGNFSFHYQYTQGSASATGTWSVQYFDGSIEYDDEKYYLNINTTNSDGQDNKGYSTAEYEVSDQRSISLGALNLRTDYNSDIFKTQSTVLSRTGNKYTGYLKALDGDLDTSWADYVDWYIEITDPNDGDKDGVPDFTDPIERAIAPTSVDISGWNWHSWPWVYNHSIQNWLYYHKGASGYAVWNNSDRSWYEWNNVTGSWNKLSQ